MNPVLSEIYSTVLGGAPYVIAAYALIFAILMVYVIMTTMKLKNTEKKLDALEEHVEELLAAKKRAGLVFCVCEIERWVLRRLPLFFLGGKGRAWRWGARCSFAAVLVRAGVQPFWAFSRSAFKVSYNTPTQSNGPCGASFSQMRRCTLKALIPAAGMGTLPSRH